MTTDSPCMLLFWSLMQDAVYPKKTNSFLVISAIQPSAADGQERIFRRNTMLCIMDFWTYFTLSKLSHILECFPKVQKCT